MFVNFNVLRLKFIDISGFSRYKAIG